GGGAGVGAAPERAGALLRRGDARARDAAPGQSVGPRVPGDGMSWRGRGGGAGGGRRGREANRGGAEIRAPDLRPRRLWQGKRRPMSMVHFIGAGPGAPDLITVRGLNLIRRCPVVLYAGSLVPRAIVAEAPPDALVIDTAPLDLDQIVRHIQDA